MCSWFHCLGIYKQSTTPWKTKTSKIQFIPWKWCIVLKCSIHYMNMLERKIEIYWQNWSVSQFLLIVYSIKWINISHRNRSAEKEIWTKATETKGAQRENKNDVKEDKSVWNWFFLSKQKQSVHRKKWNDSFIAFDWIRSTYISAKHIQDEHTHTHTINNKLLMEEVSIYGQCVYCIRFWWCLLFSYHNAHSCIISQRYTVKIYFTPHQMLRFSWQKSLEITKIISPGKRAIETCYLSTFGKLENMCRRDGWSIASYIIYIFKMNSSEPRKKHWKYHGTHKIRTLDIIIISLGMVKCKNRTFSEHYLTSPLQIFHI